MGIPKFYRWISERYPCLSEVVKEHEIPEFDGLYLDMNGIIHQCSHPNDEDPHFRITEEKIFKDIFHYIEILFRMIKPKQSFFMAVDGVAPRAKMNQQRGRRFRAAKCAEDAIKEAIEKGEELPSEERFDSNCITPGTHFMARLHEQLKYFVNRKVTEDRSWQDCDIYLSGHDCPGEGEHKIMDFIRWKRSQPNYDPNTRHCLYGLDADLMMLGLSSHDPRFSLLREEVRFGKQAQSKRITAPEETTFHLLHLGLMREYIELEFSDVKNTVRHFDLDRLIDDWILMAFLVGNDFIPHLPNLHIHHDALTVLYDIYKSVMPRLSGYINEGGRLNLERFEVFMTELGNWDEDSFRGEFEDLSWLEGKKALKGMDENGEPKNEKRNHRGDHKASVGSRNGDDAAISLNNPFALLDQQRLQAAMEEDEDDVELEDFGLGEAQLVQRVGELTMDDGVGGVMSGSDMTAEEMFQMEFKQHKAHYYMEKMGYKEVTQDVLRQQAETYVTAIQWNLLYYYEGCSSWGWFYPHHYAPYASDIRGFKSLELKFEMGTPFLPFQQLLAVLPPYSKKHLPQAYHNLMTLPTSPVIDFYPTNFDLDLNGKQQEWEAVVCIPFIEERRLLAAMSTVEGFLTPEERQRNAHGPALLYQHSKTSLGVYKSSLVGAFPDIKENHAMCTRIPREDMLLPGNKIRKGFIPNPKADVYYPGFPTLRHLKFNFKLKKDNVKVFQQPSRGETMCLSLLDVKADATVDAVADVCLGKTVFVQWPHLTEAFVVAVCDGARRIALREKNAKPPVLANSDQGGKNRKAASCLGPAGAGVGGVANAPPEQRYVIREDLTQNENHKWQVEANQLSDRYKDRYGIDTGPCTAVSIYVCPMVGRKYVMHGGVEITLQKQWASVAQPALWQTSIADLKIQESSVTKFSQVDELFPIDCTVFMLGSPHYGSEGVVKEVDKATGRIRVAFQAVEEPDLSAIIRDQRRLQLRYMPGYVAAQELGVSSHLVSRITGSIYVSRHNDERNTDSKINIGLNLKFSKRNKEIPGFTRKSFSNGREWEYSVKAVDVIRDYMTMFPEVFDGIQNASNSDVYDEDVIWPGQIKSRLQELQNWLKELPCHGIEQTPCGTERLDEGIIRAIEDQVDVAEDEEGPKAKKVVMRVRPHLLYRPLGALGITQIPDPTASYDIFDRIVNVRDGYSVPLGLRGTVVGVTQAAQEAERVYEVLFDREFQGGLSARASGPRMYRLPLMAMVNLSHGTRKEPAAYQTLRPTAIVHPVNATGGGGQSARTESFADAVSGGNKADRKAQHIADRPEVAKRNANKNIDEEDMPGAYPKQRPTPERSTAPKHQQHQGGQHEGQHGGQRPLNQKQQPKQRLDLKAKEEKEANQEKQMKSKEQKTVRTVEIIDKSATQPKFEAKDNLPSQAALNSNAENDHFERLMKGLEGASSTKTETNAPPSAIEAARQEQSEALKKILNISSLASAPPTAQQRQPPAPLTAWTAPPPPHRSENVVALEEYVSKQMKISTKPIFKVTAGDQPGTHVATVTVECRDGDGPLTLSSEPKMSPEFAIDVVSSMALQTLTIKQMIKQMGGASSPAAAAAEEEERLQSAARLLPSPGSAFTAVGSPHQTLQRPFLPPQPRPQRHMQPPRAPMPMMMPPFDMSGQALNGNPLAGLIPARMMTPSVQHAIQRQMPPNVIPHMSLQANPHDAFRQPPPVPAQPGLLNFPGSYPGSHPANAGGTVGVTRPPKDSNHGTPPVHHHVAQLPEEIMNDRPLSKSNIPPAFVPLQVAKKNRARDRESTEEREVNKAPAPVSAAEADEVVTTANIPVDVKAEANEPGNNEDSVARESATPVARNDVTTPGAAPADGAVTAEAAAKDADATKPAKVYKPREQKKKSRVAANFGGVQL